MEEMCSEPVESSTVMFLGMGLSPSRNYRTRDPSTRERSSYGNLGMSGRDGLDVSRPNLAPELGLTGLVAAGAGYF